MAGSHAAGVFAEGHVPHVMEAIFDAPMATSQGQQLGGIGLVPRQTGDPVGGLGRGLAADRALTFDLEHLCNPGPVEVVIEGRGAGKLAGLDAAVTFVEARSRLLLLGF